MRRHRKSLLAVIALIILAASVSPLLADDWPTFRHDPARSGVTAETMAMPLHLQWVHQPRQAPRPAWPEPVQEMHRMPFDYAYQVAAAKGLVYFGSSADDKICALDAVTGQERWRFYTDGPIRFAPMVYEGRVLVASDDGWLYCLGAETGDLIWKFRGGPGDEKLLGNERMISRWPMRTGVVVEGGIAYFTAGMWPAEGVYVYAVRVEDGSVVWNNDSSGSMYIKLPHPTAEGFSGVAPQGHMVAYENVLLVPTGRSVPAAFDRETGRLLYYQPGWPTYQLRQGGSWVSAAAGMVFCGVHPGGPDIDVLEGRREPTSGDGLGAWYVRSGARRFDIRGRHRLAVDGDTLYCSGSGNVTAYDLPSLLAGKKRAECILWESAHPRAYSLIVAGDAVLVGGNDTVTAMDAAGGEAIWSAQVPGEARGLAVSDGRLLVSTSTGSIACFGGQEVANPPTILEPADQSLGDGYSPDAATTALAESILQQTGVTAGYCLVVGVGDGRLAYELARRSDLTIYCVEQDAEKADAARRALDGAGLYGTRVIVHHGSLDQLAYPNYFADLVVAGSEATGDLDGRSLSELYRVLRPCGGTAYLTPPAGARADTIARLRNVVQDSGEQVEQLRASDRAVQVVRAALPGAGAWTHQYGDAGRSGASDDERVRWPLKLLWFGGPGPAGMLGRHWRAGAPLSTNGRMFIGGQHTVIGVDAYNGRELWRRDFRNVARRGVHAGGGNLAADDDSVYAAIGGVCFRLDAGTGETRQVYALPTVSPHFALDQPRTFELRVDDDHSGQVTLEATDEGLVVKLVTADDKVTKLHRDDAPGPGGSWVRFIESRITIRKAGSYTTGGDCWELYFDFRRAEDRGGLYGPGAFQLLVAPASVEQDAPSCRPAVGPAHPQAAVEGALTATGSETIVKLPWSEIEGLAGSRPTSFAFGVALNSSDDGDKLTTRTHKFANADSYRLTNGWAAFLLEGEEAAPDEVRRAGLLPAEVADSHVWGSPIVIGDTVIGTAGTVLAPHFIQYWSTFRTPTESEYVFALGKDDGNLRWVYEAEGTVAHHAMAAGGNLIFIIDRTSKAMLEQMKRRGEPAVEKVAVVALDVTTGETVWKTDEDLAGRDVLSLADGVLLASGAKGMTAYNAVDGDVLWTRDLGARRPPVIAAGAIYAEPYAVDLETGDLLTREHPLTGESVDWIFRRAYGCGTVSGAANLLFFRSGALGFADLASDTGTHNFGGIRPGCHINVIAANGLVLSPDASSSCTCAYNYQTTVALMPTEVRNEDWSVVSMSTGAGTRIRQLRVNLGAAGDRRGSDGKAWLGFPRPIYTGTVPVPMVTQFPAETGHYQRNADDLEILGTQRPWLYASGYAGLRSATLDLLTERPVFASPCDEAPEIDGLLDDTCWDGRHPLPVADEQRNQDPRITAFLRSDADNLYVAFECKAAIRDGAPVPWTANSTGENAPVWSDDSWQIFLTDRPRKAYLRLGVAASGARYSAKFTYSAKPPLDAKWNGEWTSEVSATREAWVAEMAIPWETLTEAGLHTNTLRINILGFDMTGDRSREILLRYPGTNDFDRCDLFTDVSLEEPPEVDTRQYTVRLHFVEPRDTRPGQDVVDVRLQGNMVLEGLDVIGEAGARNTALIKEFDDVAAGDTLSLELLPRSGAGAGPVVAAIEVYEM